MRKLVVLAALIGYAVFVNHVINAQNLDKELTLPTPVVEVAEQVVVEVVEEEVVEETSYIVELDDYAGENDTVVRLQRISAYNLVPNQTSADPSTSSCGPSVEKQIAVSRDLFFDEHRRKHLCGSRVTVITDRGEVFEDYLLNDTMNARYTLAADVVYPGTSQQDIQAALAFSIPTGTLIIHAD